MMGKGQILGGPSAFLFLLLLQWDISAPSTMPYHLVLAPFVLQAETSEKICVHVTQLNKSVTVNITLENLAETRTSHVVSKTHPFQCIPFQVPRLSNSPEASEATLTVEVAVEVDIGLLVAHERQQVLVRNPESLVFVQTDKPIYKPGQEVRFRIMSVDEDFRPLNETFPLVYIQQPVDILGGHRLELNPRNLARQDSSILLPRPCSHGGVYLFPNLSDFAESLQEILGSLPGSDGEGGSVRLRTT
uniref:Macroglobulin domain-containing protein n=1 Tax=Podarcis muralis TaxID=64176 RepID=A0A670HNX8_PODMU